MAQNWDYAELSKAAKAAGGPEKYIELLEKASKETGKLEMLPWIGAAAVGSLLLTAATIKVVDYLKSKKKSAENEILLAKEEIINGIKEYDEAHANEERNEEGADVPEL
ncbi:MAG: hypothetical protein ACLTEG_06795 [Acutalibacter sp.]|nr:putative uncharacterized protein [Clostridium sp. CAG:1013]